MLMVSLMYGNVVDDFIGISEISRSGGFYIAEIIGTFILVITILSLSSQRNEKISLIVGFLVGGMLLATSSTMFANPQVTIARIFTLSAAGISLIDALVFIMMQIIGAILAVLVWKAHLIHFCNINNSK